MGKQSFVYAYEEKLCNEILDWKTFQRISKSIVQLVLYGDKWI